MTTKDIELATKTFSQRDAEDHIASLVISTKHLRIINTNPQSLQKVEEKGTFIHSNRLVIH